ncbi:hypothetical protein LCGC14_2910670 [marine sediment metagenome]|uniref:Carbon storage regulator n=1 Tax=marine sediment metagenome TaxID=412755 RepID=A0A0F8XRQ1_9ZZZZ
MLVLTRKLGQSVIIGNDIKVTVIAIGKRQVKLGVDASRNVIVHREEVYKRIMEENKAALGTSTIDLKTIAQDWKKMKKSKNLICLK